MNCEKFELYGSAYIDNMLSDKEKLEFENHISECTNCSVKLQNLKTIIESMNDIEEVDLPINFSSELRTKLEKEKASQTNNIKFNKKKMLSIIAAGIFIIITSVSLMNNSLHYKNENNLFGAADKSSNNQEKISFRIATEESEESTEAHDRADKSDDNQPMIMALDNKQESQELSAEDGVEEISDENSNNTMTARSSDPSLEDEDLQRQQTVNNHNKPIIYLTALISLIVSTGILIYKKLKK